MGLDIVAHWLHCHVTLEMGKGSHKAFGPESNPILRIYYTNRKVLFAMCAGNEIFYRWTCFNSKKQNKSFISAHFISWHSFRTPFLFVVLFLFRSPLQLWNRWLHWFNYATQRVISQKSMRKMRLKSNDDLVFFAEILIQIGVLLIQVIPKR